MRGISKSPKLLLSSPSRCSARICFGPALFLFANDLPASLSSLLSALYADDLVVWSSSFFFSVSAVVEATSGALIRLEC